MAAAQEPLRISERCSALEVESASVRGRSLGKLASKDGVVRSLESFCQELDGFQASIKLVKESVLSDLEVASDDGKARLSPLVGQIRSYEMSLLELEVKVTELLAEAHRVEGGSEDESTTAKFDSELAELNQRYLSLEASEDALEFRIPPEWEEDPLSQSLRCEMDRVLSFRRSYRSIHADYLAMRDQFCRLSEINEKMKRDRATAAVTLEDVQSFYEPQSEALQSFLKELRGRYESLQQSRQIRVESAATADCPGVVNAPSDELLETRKSVKALRSENLELEAKSMRIQRMILSILGRQYDQEASTVEFSEEDWEGEGEEGAEETDERFGDANLERLLKKAELKSRIRSLDTEIEQLSSSHSFPADLLLDYAPSFTQNELEKELSLCREELVCQIAVDSEIVQKLIPIYEPE